MHNKISVLDKGYVRRIETFGSDLTIVNSARVSFDKSVEYLGRRDYSLIDYLIQNRHDSVLRHCAMSFEVYAPLFVARQWWKHHVGATAVDDQNGWNESSRRYVTEEPEFYLPSEWRAAPSNKKQGSDEPVDEIISAKYSRLLEYFNETSVHAYNSAMEDGICTEQARLFLPAYAMYVRWRWTASLNALLHFIDLRKDSHAQWEMQQYALAIAHFVKESFPTTYTSWEKFRG
jgi:thymidylate synthase (FAD)